MQQTVYFIINEYYFLWDSLLASSCQAPSEVMGNLHVAGKAKPKTHLA